MVKYQGYFVREIQAFSEQMLRSPYSTTHALGLVPTSTIPRDGTCGTTPRACTVSFYTLISRDLQRIADIIPKFLLLKLGSSYNRLEYMTIKKRNHIKLPLELV